MKSPLRILLIEDNAADARLLRGALSAEPPESFELTHLLRMNEAVVKIAKDDVDVVLLDLGLPDAHGLESVRRVVAAGPHATLIVLTGFDDDTLAASAIREGAQDYLIKGHFDDLSLWQIIRFSVERQRQQVDDRKRAEDKVLQQFSSLSVGSVDLSKLLADTSAGLGELLPHDCVAIMLSEPDHAALRLQCLDASDGESDDHIDTVIPLARSPAEKVIRSRKPLLVDQVEATEYSPEAMQHLTSRNIRSGCWVPLVSQGNAIGCLMIGSRSESAFTQHASRVLGQIASQITTAVENASVRRTREREGGQEEEQNNSGDDLILEHRFEEFIGDSSVLKQVLKDLETVAPTDATVLIQGETGTGKELLARAIHHLSTRRQRAFIKLNCAAIPSGLMESELFGHEKGAFTGAFTQKKGRIELADGGTLFLDEVGELPMDLQPKLLRALQEREIERLGGTRSISVNMRLIAATNRDLAQMMAQREFRSDLYYRLKVFPILAPSLRERRSDIPALVRHFVAKYSQRMGKTITHIQPEAMTALVKWAWPGNIRELENFIERAVILSRGSTLHVLLAELERVEIPDPDGYTMEEAEREHILQALREAKGMVGGASGAAGRLALKRTTLHSKMKKLGISRQEYT
jgi:formate hydrogenlyase transcriptional activator